MYSDLPQLNAQRPLVVHLVYSLGVGGLETLLVECINRMPPEKYRHAVVCLTGYTDVASRIIHPDVDLIALNKPPGNGLGIHWRFWKLMRSMRPTILHTYNLAAMEFCFAACWAGVPVRIHAEHGRDGADPHGRNRKHNLLRRALAPCIDRYVPVSDDLERWFLDVVGIAPNQLQMIRNGVDTWRYRPPVHKSAATPWSEQHVVIGAVARIQDVKNHGALVQAFARLRQLLPEWRDRLRLSIIGDGPLLTQLKAQVQQAQLDQVVWLPGSRSDIADVLHGFDIFVLPSLAEGTPVSLLEAMSCALPCVASRVGGIPEVIQDGEQGILSAPEPEAIAQALTRYIQDPALATRHGEAARARVEHQYSMTTMIDAYTRLYDELCARKASLVQRSINHS